MTLDQQLLIGAMSWVGAFGMVVGLLTENPRLYFGALLFVLLGGLIVTNPGCPQR